MLAWTSSIRARDVLYTRRFSQLKPEERAALRARANAHRAAVRDDEPLHGGEPQPHARHIAVGPAHVGLEDALGERGRNAGPGVLHLAEYAPASPAHAQGHFAHLRFAQVPARVAPQIA